MARAGGLKRMVEDRLADIDAREINSIPIGDGPRTASRSWCGSAATGRT